MTDLYVERVAAAAQPAAAAPVVLLNGVMMTTASWPLQTRVLAARYDVLLHDFRGQLRSPKPPGPYSMQMHVGDLLQILDEQRVERAHLIGTSYGGEVGMLFAIAHPERVASLSVIASVSHVEPPLREKIERWIAMPAEELYDATVPDNYSEAFREARPEVILIGRERLRGYAPEFFDAFRELCKAFLTIDFTEELSAIRCPTLVMCGTADALKPPHYSRTIAERIPNARLELLEGGGHAVFIEQADAVSALLMDFLASPEVLERLERERE